MPVPTEPAAMATQPPASEMMMAKYNEAPTLAELVRAGSLPPVEERLPDEPMVVEVFDEIGQYGGTLRRAFNGPNDFWGFGRLDRAGHRLVQWDNAGFEAIPAVAGSWEISDDQTTFTFHLRKGHRWSDGEPFDAADLEYQWNDVVLNEELTPKPPATLMASGQLPAFEKIDDLTVRYTFPVPNSYWLLTLTQVDALGGANRLFGPSHYESQLHADHVGMDAANKMAKDNDFDTWVDYYLDVNQYGRPRANPDFPVLNPWILTKGFDGQLAEGERNAYFYGVDPEGNQLPYIDKVQLTFVESVDVLTLKAIAGEIDMQGRHVKNSDFPVLIENEAKGDYTVYKWPQFGGTNAGVYFNMSWEGPEADLIKNRDFRYALSLAINRDEVNETVFQGQGVPRQGVPAPASPEYPGDQWAFFMTEYDPDKANQMLDDLGLDKRDADGMRLMPNGERLALLIDVFEGFGSWADSSESVSFFWGKVGVRTGVNLGPRGIIDTRTAANESMLINAWVESTCCTFKPGARTDPGGNGHIGPLILKWFTTDGAEGMEPPQEMKELHDLHLKGPENPTAERNKIGQEIYERYAMEMYHIGLVGLAPDPFVVKNNLYNVPEISAHGWPHRTPAAARPEQWFFK